MHSALVASQSAAFGRLVNNANFKEGQTHHAELEKIEEETFIRFFQYAYTGKYDEGEVEPPPVDAEPAKPTTVEADSWPEAGLAISGWGFAASSSGKKKKSNMKGKSTFSGWDDPVPEEEPAPDPIPTPPKGIYDPTSRTIVFEALAQKFVKRVSTLSALTPNPTNKIQIGGPATSNPYLLHAKIFVFADYWGVTGLKEVSLRKLSAALQEVGLLVNTKWVRDRLVTLVEYCHEEPRPEELVTLVHLYAAFRLPQLWESEKFRELYGHHTELSVALMKAVVESGL